MKRHISIFAFLLSAFAAGGATAAGNQSVTAWGYWPPEPDSVYIEDTNWIEPDGGNTMFTDPLVFSAPLPKGWKVRHWRVKEVLLFNNGDPDTAGSTLDDSLGKADLVWGYSKDYGNNVFLAVKYDYIKYDLKYDLDGGSGTAKGTNDVSYVDEYALASAPTKAGYTFRKWKASSNGAEFDAGATVRGGNLCLDTWHEDGNAVTMIAQWTANTYTVCCDLDGGSWSAGYEPPVKAFYDQVFSLSAPSRTGYAFVGWKATSGLDAETARWGSTETPTATFDDDTICFNDGKDVYFLNLNPTNGVAVTLTGRWQPKAITVMFNNKGGSSGGGILDTLPVTYDAAYPAINAPTKGGNLFRGYEIDGIQYWNSDGQPTRMAWDIPTNCTAFAQWEELAYQLTYNENRSDGTVSKTVVRDFEYGKPTELYDGADFSNRGYTLLGWSTDPNAQAPSYEPGGSATFTESKTLYAVWEKNYFIAYDGNGATNETPMAVQKFVFGKANQSLNPNAYGKVGYSFLGWATNRVAAQRLDWTYGDRQILRDDLARTLGETNTLSATWGTNTYSVAFDPNGAIGDAMPVLTCKYDQPVTLPAATYSKDIHDFVGWSNDVEKVIYADLSEPVSNLCSVANGTNTLYAVWKSAIGPLSEAMGCDNLKWDREYGTWTPGETAWTNGGGTVSCALHTGYAYASMKTVNTITSGTLRFWWKSTGGEQAVVWGADRKGQKILEETDGEWRFVKLELDSPEMIVIYHRWGDDEGKESCCIAKMSWTPGGSKPEPTDADKVTISSAEVSDGKFRISFEFNEEFDYLLKTNANLLIDSWGVMENEGTKTDKILTFEPAILPGQPQLFYKVETIQKK